MRRPSISLIGGLLVAMAGILTGLPAHAHKTEISGNVAGTWHLEPNHSARAGEPARVWVALTQQGGRVIPLEQCDCNLAVYKANQTDSAPVMQPALTAMSPERFQNIPGAEITFPEVGEYRIVLTGSPTADATFTPFELSYTTVVAAGSASAATPPSQSAMNQGSSEPVPASSDRESVAAPAQASWVWGIAIAVAGVGVAIAIVLLLRQQNLSGNKNDS
ncbi:hypothetical protein IQ273_13045 [Nodosilinea sp. LEGE 07298]|uniref:hypothetical protein n=1 Tax=Nodosilinea sp. LEGE 07298 TaxID=2777970 RepID=UPI0018823C6B|nr:hypothetical protein [Nodosilinea sp. LEGE 07298]MBE9110340.1 hypothetical protein [Nodosilinea sp. LEGE 07298]